MSQQDLEERIGQHWKRWGRWATAIVLALLVWMALVYALYWFPPAGFGGRYNLEGEWREYKTWWDWMDLLLVPAVLAVGAAVFTWLMDRRQRDAEDRRARAERESEERRAKTERDIALDRSREIALQTYFDRLADQLATGLRGSEQDDPKRSIARARTFTVLRQLDGERKGLLLRFLYEAGLIGEAAEGGQDQKEAIVDLSRADLTKAHLRGVKLTRAKLIGANMQGASLSGADLHGASLERANLSGAVLYRSNLEGADLSHASLVEADLGFAELDGANLYEARLSKAVLSRAHLRRVNLEGANLEGADLERANLEGANLYQAFMDGANLIMAELRVANLEGAGLPEAYLCEADLTGANLSEANMRGAKLQGAEATEEQLAQAATLEGAIMPDGTIYTSPEPTPPDTEPDTAEREESKSVVQGNVQESGLGTGSAT